MRSAKWVCGLWLCLLVVPVLLCPTGADGGDPSKYPWKPIEWLTHSAPGSPGNILGLLVIQINQEEKIFSQPVFLTQKAGSGMANAFAYMFEKKGEDHMWASVPSSLVLGTPLTIKVPYSYKDFTPIANLATDGSVLSVSSKSPYKTIDDFINEARKRPNQLSQAVSSLTSNEAMMGRIIQKNKGVRWKLVSFKGEAEAASNVLGGNVDCTFLNPTSVVDHVRAGNLRVILSGSAERYKDFPDVPTIKEAGLGEPSMTFRGIMGPPGMPAYAVKALEAGAKKVLASPRFQKYLETSMQQQAWMGSAEYGKFLAKEQEVVRQQFIEAGAIKP
jgi:putative tricarboxylic transport membrane protein